MPKDGHSGGGRGGTDLGANTRGRQGLGANNGDGGRSGGSQLGRSTTSWGRGNPDQGDPNDSPAKGPSMGGILQYVKSRGSGMPSEGGPDSDSDNTPEGASGEYESPVPTGGDPRKDTSDAEGYTEPCEACGHVKKEKKRVARASTNEDTKEP